MDGPHHGAAPRKYLIEHVRATCAVSVLMSLLGHDHRSSGYSRSSVDEYTRARKTVGARDQAYVDVRRLISHRSSGSVPLTRSWPYRARRRLKQYSMHVTRYNPRITTT